MQEESFFFHLLLSALALNFPTSLTHVSRVLWKTKAALSAVVVLDVRSLFLLPLYPIFTYTSLNVSPADLLLCHLFPVLCFTFGFDNWLTLGNLDFGCSLQAWLLFNFRLLSGLVAPSIVVCPFGYVSPGSKLTISVQAGPTWFYSETARQLLSW